MDPEIFDFGGKGGGGQTLVQTGSRIDTDRFPKRVPNRRRKLLGGSGGMLPGQIIFRF